MAELPTDIAINILSKLRVKSLLRFQCVSKQWQSTIRNPKFIKTHLNQTLISNSDRHLHVSVNHSYFISSELDLFNNQLSFSFSECRRPHKPSSKLSLYIVGSCNGIVCMTEYASKTEVVLLNPLTNSLRKLPYNNFPVSFIHKMVFGFGYDCENDDYKVLRIVQERGEIDVSKFKVEVYSLKTNSWRCAQGMPYYLYDGIQDGVLFNEGLHYLVTKNWPCDECLFIAKFDLRTDTFSLIHCPNNGEFDSLKSCIKLTELGRCLCLLIRNSHYTFEKVYTGVDLWVMKEYENESSWVKLFSIHQPEDIGSYKYITPLVYSKDGRRILLDIDGSSYCWYDLEFKTVERVTAHGLPIERFDTQILIGSIVSVHN